MGALWQVCVIFGLHWGLVPLMINNLAVLWPRLNAANAAACGDGAGGGRTGYIPAYLTRARR